MSTSLSLDQQVIHVYVAMQNLAHGRAINDIADELGLSRFATARMVARARDRGLIEVRSTIPDPVDVALSARLAKAYGLRSALVVATPSAVDEEVREALARIAARFIVENVEEDDVLGVSPGRGLVRVSRLISQLPCADIVQLTGVGAPRLEDGVEAISNLGRASGGATYPLYAPILIQDPSVRAILQHPANSQTIRRFGHVTKAFLTIGGWPDSSLLAQQVAELGGLPPLVRAGVVAEIGTTLLTAAGDSVADLEDRLVGITEQQLRSVDMRVAIGGGKGKERAVTAVLRSGLASVVITDVRSAQIALDE